MQVALQGSAMDPTTGTIDMDLIQTGISAADRTLRAQLTQELRSLIQRALLPTLTTSSPVTPARAALLLSVSSTCFSFAGTDAGPCKFQCQIHAVQATQGA